MLPTKESGDSKDTIRLAKQTPISTPVTTNKQHISALQEAVQKAYYSNKVQNASGHRSSNKTLPTSKGESQNSSRLSTNGDRSSTRLEKATDVKSSQNSRRDVSPGGLSDSQVPTIQLMINTNGQGKYLGINVNNYCITPNQAAPLTTENSARNI